MKTLGILLLSFAFSAVAFAGLKEGLQQNNTVIDTLITASIDPYLDKQGLRDDIAATLIDDTGDEALRTLTGLVELSLFDRGRDQNTGYIESGAVLNILIATLDDGIDDLRELSLDLLYDHARSDTLATYVAELTAAIDHNINEKLYLLLGMTDNLGLLPVLHNLQIEGIEIPPEVFARLGDASLQNQFILDYQNETDPEKKGELAMKLGYIASNNAVTAIAQDMRSPLAIITRYYEISHRYAIVQALHRVYSHEFLFTTRLMQILNRDHDELRESGAGDTYMSEVESWLSSHLGIIYTAPRPSFLLLYYTAAPYVMPEGP